MTVPENPWLQAGQRLSAVRQRACGHDDFFAVQRAVAEVRFSDLPNPDGAGDTTHFVSMSGGDQRISVEVCTECSVRTGYLLRRAGGDVERIGGDPEVLAAAFSALLTQPSVEVFTVVVDRKDRERMVIPRHRLPSFLVGGRR